MTAFPTPCRQLGIVNFEPLRPYFLELHAGAAASLPLLPGVPPVSASLDRNWSGDAGATPPTAPALVREPLPGRLGEGTIAKRTEPSPAI